MTTKYSNLKHSHGNWFFVDIERTNFFGKRQTIHTMVRYNQAYDCWKECTSSWNVSSDFARWLYVESAKLVELAK